MKQKHEILVFMEGVLKNQKKLLVALKQDTFGNAAHNQYIRLSFTNSCKKVPYQIKIIGSRRNTNQSQQSIIIINVTVKITFSVVLKP